MKLKVVGISIVLFLVSMLFTLYVFGELYSDIADGLVSPVNATFTSNHTVIFNCTAATNLTKGIQNITLWLGKQGEVFAFNRTNTSALGQIGGIKNVSSVFNQFNLSEGLWYWNCKGFNGTTAIAYSQITNNTLVIDETFPVITFNASNTATANNTFINPNTTNQKIIVAVNISELWQANLSYSITMANGSGPVLNFTRNNAGGNLYNLTYLSINVNLTVINGSADVNNSVLGNTFSDAVLLIVVNVTDQANQQTTLRRTVTTDSIDPLLSITAPLNGTTFKANATSLAIIFNISHSDTNLNASRAIYRIGAATGISNNSFTQNTSEIVNTSATITLSMNATNQIGEYGTVVYFITKDKAGREVVNHTTITLDLAPVIALNKPAQSQWSQATTHLLNFTAINNDTNVSSLASCELWGNMVGKNASYNMNQSYNGTIMGLYNGTTQKVNFTVTLVEGNYTWGIWCNDTTSNNIYSENRTFYVDTTSPTVSVSTSVSGGAASYTLGGTATVSCSATDIVDPSPTSTVSQVVKPSGATVLSPGNSISNLDQTGTYTVTCDSTDASGRSASATASFVVDYSSQGGNGGSGSGGAATQVQSVSLSQILPGSPALMKLSDAASYSLKQIELDVVNIVNNVKLTVTKMTSKPSSATTEAAATVYKYIQVEKQNIVDADISKASLNFQVEKSWLNGKSATKDQVVMKRLSGSSWDTLTTTQTDEDDKYYYYKASSPGLSYFAVALQEKPAAATTEKKEEAKPAEGQAAPEQMAPAKKSKTWLWVTLTVVLVAAAGLALYLKKSKKSFRP